MRGDGPDVLTASAEPPHQAAAISISSLAEARLTASVDAARAASCHRSIDVTLRCLIVDDNARFCESMRSLLEDEGLSIVAVAASGGEAERFIRDVAVDVALVDIDLGDE